MFALLVYTLPVYTLNCVCPLGNVHYLCILVIVFAVVQTLENLKVDSDGRYVRPVELTLSTYQLRLHLATTLDTLTSNYYTRMNLHHFLLKCEDQRLRLYHIR